MNSENNNIIILDHKTSIPWMYKSGWIEYFDIPIAHRDLCIFGMCLHEIDITLLVHDFPKSTRSIYSLCANKFLPYLNRMIELELNSNMEVMYIGLQHEYIDLKHNFFEDFSTISQILEKNHFPNLKVFKFGFDELYINESNIYPSLGDITTVIEQMPALQILEVTGAFKLTQPLNLNHLKALSVDVDLGVENSHDIISISQKTLDFLMASKMNTLESFELCINNTDFNYHLNLDFFKQFDLSKLQRVSIYGTFQKELESQIYDLLHPFVKNIFIENH